MSKLIFLDIDGVLNSTVYVTSDYYQNAIKGMSDAEVMLIAHHLHLDPLAVELVNKLVEKSGAEVILSSTWRGKYPPDVMTEMLHGRGARFKIAANTPALFGKKFGSPRIPRGKEIAAYLRNLPEQPESFVILDDHDDMIHLKKFLVLTSAKVGITTADVERALKILAGESDDPEIL